MLAGVDLAKGQFRADQTPTQLHSGFTINSKTLPNVRSRKVARVPACSQGNQHDVAAVDVGYFVDVWACRAPHKHGAFPVASWLVTRSNAGELAEVPLRFDDTIPVLVPRRNSQKRQ